MIGSLERVNKDETSVRAFVLLFTRRTNDATDELIRYITMCNDNDDVYRRKYDEL